MSDDLQVVVDQPPEPVKPSAQPAKAPFWTGPRNKALIAAGLLCLLAIPAVVAPVVVTQRRKAAEQQQSTALQNSSGGANAVSATGPGEALDGGDPTDQFVMLNSTAKSRSFNASAIDTNSSANSTQLKVPERSLNKTRTANVAKKSIVVEPEVVTPFVSIEDGQFDLNCRPFYPVGFNAYELTTLSATGRKQLVDDVFKNAASMGMTAARTWAHSISDEFPFQTAPGQYDETGLKALDYVLHSASQHGIKLILSFIDNWKYYNGVDQYVDWCGPGRSWERFKETGGDTDTLQMSVEQKKYETVRHALFFKEEKCKQLYKDHVDVILTRVNSYNGRTYKNDPTILSWNLINEPRCETWMPENSNCPADMQAWFKEMAEYVKSKDPNHLVSSGSEGFFGPNDPNVSKNPQSWAAQTGQDFVEDNRHMDFAVAHAWPDNWEIPNDRQGDFLRQWLDSHLSAAQSIGKPLLFEEFGKKLSNPDDEQAIRELRDPVYQTTYDAVQDAVEDGQPLLGSLYWKWFVPGTAQGPYGVDMADSTMKVIRNHATTMHRLVNAVPPRAGCALPASPNKALGAWFASASPDADERGCVNAPEVSLAYYNLYGPEGTPDATSRELGLSPTAVAYAKALRAGQVYAYPTKADCCRAGALGAYPGGCTV